MGVSNSKKKILIYGLEASKLLLLYTFYKHFNKDRLLKKIVDLIDAM